MSDIAILKLKTGGRLKHFVNECTVSKNRLYFLFLYLLTLSFVEIRRVEESVLANVATCDTHGLRCCFGGNYHLQRLKNRLDTAKDPRRYTCSVKG